MTTTALPNIMDSTQPFVALPSANLHSADIAVIAIYFVFILVVGIWAMCRTDRSNVNGFFLAGRNITWFPVGASLFSSNIGSGHFVGLAGTGAAAGIAVGAFEWNAILTLYFLGWIFAPIYISAGVVTMPEYLKKRFGGQRIQVYISVLSILLYIFTKVSADLFAGAIFIQEALGWNIYVAMVTLLAITALYTVTGGLAAVIYTDTAQTFIMLSGAFVMMILSFIRVGGYEGLKVEYMKAIPSIRPTNTTCGLPRADAFHVFRDPVTADLPWPGLTIGLTILATWYWCTDQVIVQRTLAAKDLTHAKGGCVAAGFMKILPMYMMVMVGMVSRVVFPDAVACATPSECEKYCGTPVGCSNIAYPKLVLEIMPTGLKGLLLAVMMAALMSSLTSVFNSASTLFTCDLWMKIRKDATERELMIVGRLFILFMVGVSIAWVPIIQLSANGQLFDYIQAITSYLGPPIMVVFVLGIFWPRLNEPGAFWSLMLGLVVGLIRMTMDFALTPPLCGEDEYRPAVLYKVHYLYFAMILATVTAIVAVVVSLLTKEIPKEKLNKLTWYTRFGDKKDEDIAVSVKEVKETGFCNLNFVDDNNEKPENNGFENNAKSQICTDNVENEEGERSFCRKAIDLFCGLDSRQSQVSSESTPIITDISEKKIPSQIVNTFGLVMLLVMTFLFGYYA